MYNDISGNSLVVGDSVFIIKSFVKNHYAKTFEMDEYPDIIDQELEDARSTGYVDPSLPKEDADEFEYYTNEPQTYKRFIDKDNYIPEDYDIDESDKIEVGNKVQLLASKAQTSEDIQTGRIIYIDPSSDDKLQQLKESINKILLAEESNEQNVNLNDYIFSGTIPSEDFNSAIVQRSEQINFLSKNALKKDRADSTVYVQPIDTTNKNGASKAILNSLSNYIESTLINEDSKVLVNNLEDDFLLSKAESIRDKVPNFLKFKSPIELLQLYPNFIINIVKTQ